MSTKSSPPKRIAVLAHPEIPDAMAEVSPVYHFLQDRGVEVLHGSLYDDGLRAEVEKGGVDVVIALGGDGTMLRAGRLCAQHDVPVLGINLGHFGFLMEIDGKQWRSVLPQLLEGDYWLEKRMMLCAQHWCGEEKLGQWDALNEVVIGRGLSMRPVRLTASVDGHVLTTYVADALIAATPTGSTAYALAAGGPIMPPELRNILIVPVAPHLSVDRAVVLAEGTEINITVRTAHQAALSIDGQPPVNMADGDRVHVATCDHTAAFVRFQDPSYFYRNLTSHMEKNPSIGGNLQ